jgi:hypothetical protein
MRVVRAASASVDVSPPQDRAVAMTRGKTAVSARRSGVGLSQKFIEAIDIKLSRRSTSTRSSSCTGSSSLGRKSLPIQSLSVVGLFLCRGARMNHVLSLILLKPAYRGQRRSTVGGDREVTLIGPFCDARVCPVSSRPAMHSHVQSPSPAAIERALANGGARPDDLECGSGPHDRDDGRRQAGAGAAKERLKDWDLDLEEHRRRWVTISRAPMKI